MLVQSPLSITGKYRTAVLNYGNTHQCDNKCKKPSVDEKVLSSPFDDEQ